MRTVKITAGGYGYHNGKRVVLKDRGSESFKLDDTEAARIVALGIAEYAETEVATPVPAEEAETAGVNTTETANAAEGEYEGGAPDLDNMTFAELKELAIKRGVKGIGKLKSKAALAAAILDSEDAPPELGAEEPVL